MGSEEVEVEPAASPAASSAWVAREGAEQVAR